MNKQVVFLPVIALLANCTAENAHRQAFRTSSDSIYKACQPPLKNINQGTAQNGKKSPDHYDRVIDENLQEFCEEQARIAGNQQKSSGEASMEPFVNGLSNACGAGSQDCPYAPEKTYLDDEWPPKLGLALSGGGTRAASFSVGVMKALEKQKILDRVDVISSVSGGGLMRTTGIFPSNFTGTG